MCMQVRNTDVRARVAWQTDTSPQAQSTEGLGAVTLQRYTQRPLFFFFFLNTILRYKESAKEMACSRAGTGKVQEKAVAESKDPLKR